MLGIGVEHGSVVVLFVHYERPFCRRLLADSFVVTTFSVFDIAAYCTLFVFQVCFLATRHFASNHTSFFVTCANLLMCI